MKEPIKEVDPLIAESQKIREAALANVKEGYNPPMSADDHRNTAKRLSDKADELLSGDKKDSFITASQAHARAADAIETAHKSSAKVEALEN